MCQCGCRCCTGCACLCSPRGQPFWPVPREEASGCCVPDGNGSRRLPCWAGCRGRSRTRALGANPHVLPLDHSAVGSLATSSESRSELRVLVPGAFRAHVSNRSPVRVTAARAPDFRRQACRGKRWPLPLVSRRVRLGWIGFDRQGRPCLSQPVLDLVEHCERAVQQRARRAVRPRQFV